MHLPWHQPEQYLDEVEEFLTGVPPSRVEDRVLGTIDQHNAAVRREFARFRGEELDTAGDGFFALFDGPARAIRCALAISKELKALGLEVRAGIHTGEVERSRGGSPRGIAVHLGARLAAAAGPGEVLVSGTTHDLVAGSGLRFLARGEIELKGIGRRIVVAATQ